MTIYNKKIREKQVLKNKLLKLCQSKYKEMTAAEKLVSELIFKNNVDIFNDSINVFARKCTVTVSTINRWSKTLGFDGFKELQMYYKILLNRDVLEVSKLEYAHSSNVQNAINDIAQYLSDHDDKFALGIKKALDLIEEYTKISHEND